MKFHERDASGRRPLMKPAALAEWLASTKAGSRVVVRVEGAGTTSMCPTCVSWVAVTVAGRATNSDVTVGAIEHSPASRELVNGRSAAVG